MSLFIGALKGVLSSYNRHGEVSMVCFLPWTGKQFVRTPGIGLTPFWFSSWESAFKKKKEKEEEKDNQCKLTFFKLKRLLLSPYWRNKSLSRNAVDLPTFHLIVHHQSPRALVEQLSSNCGVPSSNCWATVKQLWSTIEQPSSNCRATVEQRRATIEQKFFNECSAMSTQQAKKKLLESARWLLNGTPQLLDSCSADLLDGCLTIARQVLVGISGVIEVDQLFYVSHTPRASAVEHT